MSEPRLGGSARTSARPSSGAIGAPSSAAKVPALAPERLTPTRSGNTRAFVTVRVGRGDNSLLIDGFKVVQEAGKRAWVAVPSQERQRVDPQTGQTVTKWYPVVTLPDAWKQAIEDAVLAAWERYQKTGELPQGSAPAGGGAHR